MLLAQQVDQSAALGAVDDEGDAAGMPDGTGFRRKIHNVLLTHRHDLRLHRIERAERTKA